MRQRPLAAAVGCLLVAAACALALAPSAFALSNLTVDSTGDGGDLANDGTCDAGGGACTLRAAIQEADDNNTAETDSITFAAGLSDQTIALGSPLPTIDEPTSINGCATIDANHAGPCVGVRPNTSTDVAFAVSGSGVTIAGLAITNAAVGIDGLDGSTGLTIKNDWFGVKLPANPYTAEANTTGVVLRSSGATVGGTAGATGSTPADRNVFSNGTTGLRIFGGDNNQVLGSFFGTRPDGATAGSQNEDIEVVSESAGPDLATGNQIGATVDAGAAATTSCDGACNLISGASGGDGYGLDVAGNGGAENPSVGTVIAGNFVGLNLTGTAALGNQNSGLALNNAPNTVVGGSSDGARNFITGPAYAMFAEPVTSGGNSAVIRNNFLGLNSAGTAVVIPGTSFAMASLRGAAASPVVFRDNRVAGKATGDGVRVGSYVTFLGNVFGIGTGGENLSSGVRAIVVSNSSPGITIGGTSPGDGNTIGNATADGIDFNAAIDAVMQGNYVGTDAGGADRGNGASGIRLNNGPTTEIPQNILIGGNTAASENVISNNAGDAIRDNTTAVPGSNIVIARNRGSGNGSTANDLFIDLGPNGPGNSGGLNGGIEAPAISSASTEAISGTAQASALVRVYTTSVAAGAVPGDVLAFVGQATADPAGNWTLPNSSFAVALAGGERASANQTSAAGSSELSPAATTIAVSTPPPALSDVTPPDTSVTGKAKVRTRKKKARVTFTFSANEPGATFTCSLDGAAAVPCISPFTRKLRRGAHTLTVKATDASGNTDPSPATVTTKVKRLRR